MTSPAASSSSSSENPQNRAGVSPGSPSPSPSLSPTPFQRALPNILTILRVFLAILFFVILSRWHVDASSLVNGKPTPPDRTLLLSAIIFIIAAITDALDGALARRWNVVSVFGRVMDPFADKVLVLGAFVILAGPAFTSRLFPYESFSCVEPWMAVAILARELLITSLRAAVEARGVSFAATASGKLKMVLQSICVPIVLVTMAYLDTRPDQGADSGNDGWVGAVPGGRLIILITVWLTVAVSLWSAVPYIIRAMRAMRTTPKV